MDIETFNEPLSNNSFNQMGGGLKNQSKPVGNYMYEKLTDIFHYDDKTAYKLLENTQYLTLTIIVSYLYSNLINNLLPYNKNFSNEKKALDLAIHIIALSIGFFLLPKLIQVVPSFMHSSKSFTSYESDSYSGMFVPIFLVVFNYQSLFNKISGFGKEVIQVSILKDKTIKKKVELIDEKVKSKTQSKAQQLTTPTHQYPDNSNVPTNNILNNQQIQASPMSGFERPLSSNSTPVKNDSTDIRDFLNTVQNDNTTQHSTPVNQLLPSHPQSNGITGIDGGMGGLASF